jgi:hypothetical protein
VNLRENLRLVRRTVSGCSGSSSRLLSNGRSAMQLCRGVLNTLGLRRSRVHSLRVHKGSTTIRPSEGLDHLRLLKGVAEILVLGIFGNLAGGGGGGPGIGDGRRSGHRTRNTRWLCSAEVSSSSVRFLFCWIAEKRKNTKESALSRRNR